LFNFNILQYPKIKSLPETYASDSSQPSLLVEAGNFLSYIYNFI